MRGGKILIGLGISLTIIGGVCYSGAFNKIEPLKKMNTMKITSMKTDFAPAKELAKQYDEKQTKIQKLENYLNRYGSPLAAHADDFVNAGEAYGVDYRVLVAIAGKEQTFGAAWPGSSLNFWGYGGHRWDTICAAIWDYTWHMSIDYPALCQGNVYAASSYAESESWESGVGYFYSELCSL